MILLDGLELPADPAWKRPEMNDNTDMLNESQMMLMDGNVGIQQERQKCALESDLGVTLAQAASGLAAVLLALNIQLLRWLVRHVGEWFQSRLEELFWNRDV